MIEPVTILQLNIERDTHLGKIEQLLRVQKPDIVTMQEVFADNVALLESFGEYASAFVPLMKDYRPESGVAKKEGLLIMWNKRFSLDTKEVNFYFSNPEAHKDPTGIRSSNERERALLTVVLMRDEKSYRVSTTHFTRTPDASVDELQREHFSVMSKELSRYDDGLGVILTGDFNTPRGSELYDALAKRYRDNIPLEVTTTLDQHLHRVKGLTYVVDGLFTTPNYSVSDVEVIDGVSDHKAILARIS
jgi:endonuclease/exonuclease/phosphatase family metal-dependent hydrolase